VLTWFKFLPLANKKASLCTTSYSENAPLSFKEKKGIYFTKINDFM